MLNPTTILGEALGNHLEDTYRKTFGPEEPTFPGKLNLVARMVMDVIGKAMSHALLKKARQAWLGFEARRPL